MGKPKIHKYLYVLTIGLSVFFLILMKLDNRISEKDYYPPLHVIQSLTTKRAVTKSLSELESVTPTLDDHVLFFNRIPKTGSEMIVLLVQWMQGLNGYKHIRLPGGGSRRLNRTQQAELVYEVRRSLYNEAVPLSFDRHVYFINFTSHGQQSPTYINLVRDPVQKVISRFYYKRATPNPKNPDLKLVNFSTQKNIQAVQEFEQCVQHKDPECTFISGKFYDLSIPYFCGHNKWCMSLNDEWALEEAKYHVEKYYPVVGVLEELNATLTVLERKVPYFFKGVRETYYRQLEEPHMNKNKQKPSKINKTLKKNIEKMLKLEYDFYFWLRQRLLKQYNQLIVRS